MSEYVKLNDVKIALTLEYKNGNLSLKEIERFLGNLKIYTKQEVGKKIV